MVRSVGVESVAIEGSEEWVFQVAVLEQEVFQVAVFQVEVLVLQDASLGI
jgi:hypothetical protein